MVPLEKVYLVGIGGTAMGNLAVALWRQGVSVRGSDHALYPPISDLLAEEGIAVDRPDQVEHLETLSDAVFIVGNAVSRGHPQVEWLLRNSGVLRMSFPEFMGNFCLSRTRNLVVAGTHGKSTTTAVAAHYLRTQSCDPGWFVGGVLADGSPAFSFSGRNDTFVIEGDEYDSAFFDKRAKFVHYRPHVLLLNNLEFDHADIYRDLWDVQRSVRQVLALVPDQGAILYNGDDPALNEILPVSWTRCLTFGEGGQNDFRLRSAENGDIIVETDLADFSGFRIRTTLRGAFNRRNAAGAILGSRLLLSSVDSGNDLVDLGDFRGLKRRQEVLVQSSERILIEDFGHHPTAMRVTLESLRELYPGWRIHAMVEPRSNTMRTRAVQDDLIEALSLADRVTFAPIHRLESVPAADRLDLETVAEALVKGGGACFLSESMEQIPPHVEETLEEDKVVTVLFSNGAFGGLIPRLREILAN